MKRTLINLAFGLLFLVGFGVLSYPTISDQWNTYRQSRLITDYEEVVAGKEAAGELNYETEWTKAETYNDALVPYIPPDSFAEAATAGEEDKEYLACLNVTGDGMMGYVQIPKINVKIPIFHTTNDDVLQRGAGHLEGSSLPIGGVNHHAVISAHRGLPSAALFTDLDKMEKGDHFLLYILDDILCYEVDQITVVEPKNTSDLTVEDNMDLVTLLTCTPYGVNSHRLLVRGHRVPYEPEDLADEKIPLGNMSFHTSYLLWVIVGLLVTGMFILLLYRQEKKRMR